MQLLLIHRQVRLGTASMLSDGGVFINAQKINLRKYASRPALAKVHTLYNRGVRVDVHVENKCRLVKGFGHFVTGCLFADAFTFLIAGIVRLLDLPRACPKNSA